MQLKTTPYTTILLYIHIFENSVFKQYCPCVSAVKWVSTMKSVEKGSYQMIHLNINVAR